MRTPAGNSGGAPGRALDLREFAERMSEAERIAHFGVFRWDLDTGRVLWSDQLHRIYGLRPGQFGGTADAFLAFLHPDDRDRVWSLVERAIRDAEPFIFQERIIRADGEERVLLSQGRPLPDRHGAVSALVGVCHDITERVRTQLALGRSEERIRAIVEHSPSMIAVKDLDGRYVMSNAETGRVLGIDAAAVIGRHCAELFPTVAAQMRQNDLRALADTEPVYDEAVLDVEGETRTYLTVTFPLVDEHDRPFETCTIATDVTERREREATRRERDEWRERIGAALDEGRMLAYAQPVVELAGGERRWCELLVRMRDAEDPERVLAPSAFLPAAERFGLIQQIDAWMVRQALTLPPGLLPEVNLSAVTLSDPAARDEIIALLQAAPEAAGLIFEITETADPGHLDAACAFAEELTALGCGLALDDFGTGFGSFTYLRRLRLRYLKIDRSFVVDLPRSGDDRRVVQSIIGIARSFGLQVIAEGVEDAATLELLRDFGAEFAQGFHLGWLTPLPDCLS